LVGLDWFWFGCVVLKARRKKGKKREMENAPKSKITKTTLFTSLKES
jgi:hypothetical protein